MWKRATRTSAELTHLLERIAQRVLALITRRGYWVDDHDTAYLQEPNPNEVLGSLQAAARSYCTPGVASVLTAARPAALDPQAKPVFIKLRNAPLVGSLKT